MATEEIVEQLYGLPPAEFTRARDEAASELRKAGQREAAERVKALHKPTGAAAAANRLVRDHRSEVERFLRAATVLRDAQFSGKGDLAAATKQEREELERLIGLGGELVRQTLLAAAADEDAARRLLEGRLERELEPVGFGTLLAYVRPAAARPGGATEAQAQTEKALPERKEPKPDDSAARARLHDTKAAFSAAETTERDARGRWEAAQREFDRARAEVEKAGGSEKARVEADKARADSERARAQVDKARAEVEQAQRDLDLLNGR